jgi:hypothetical protein
VPTNGDYEEEDSIHVTPRRTTYPPLRRSHKEKKEASTGSARGTREGKADSSEGDTHSEDSDEPDSGV